MNNLNNNCSSFVRICRCIIDYSLFFLVLSSVSLFLPGFINNIPYWLLLLLLPIFFAPIEALLLSTWGKTLGMAFFGKSITDSKGNKLSFWQALKRALFIGRKKSAVVYHQKRGKIAGFLAILVCVVGVFSTPLSKDRLLNICSVHQSVNGWMHYSAKGLNFSADFPSKPDKIAKQLEITSVRRTLDYDEFKSQPDPNISYSVSYIELPKKWGIFSSSTLLKGALSVITESSFEAQVVSKSFTNHKRYPALDYRLKLGEEAVQGRLILVGTTIFKVEILYNPSKFTKDIDLHKAEFLDSFDYTQLT